MNTLEIKIYLPAVIFFTLKETEHELKRSIKILLIVRLYSIQKLISGWRLTKILKQWKKEPLQPYQFYRVFKINKTLKT
jgi:hypothetical protein